MRTKHLLSLGITILALSGILILASFITDKNSVEVKITRGTLYEGTKDTPRFINPVLARPNNAAEQDLTELIFSRLLSHTQGGDIIWGLAKSLEKSDDGKTYILTLRDGITFHDGHPITADDVVYTVKKIQDPSTNSPLFNYWAGVTVEKENERQVRFTLVHAYDGFPYSLEIGILPKHLWEKVDDEEFAFSKLNTFPVGSGSYKVENVILDEDDKPTEYQLVKSDDREGYIRKVDVSIFKDAQDLQDALNRGNVDAVYGVDRENAQHIVQKRNTLTLYHDVLPNFFILFYNIKKDGPGSQKLVRNYLDALIDRNTLTSSVFGDYASSINTVKGEYNEKRAEEKKKSIKTFVQAFEKEEWKKNSEGIYEKDGKKLELTITTRDSQDLVRVAKEIAQQAKAGGILIHIKPYGLNQKDFFQQIIDQRNYELLLYGYFFEKPSDLYVFWHSSQRESPGLNLSMYKNVKLDLLLEKLREKNDDELLKKVDATLSEDTPASFLYRPHYIYILPKKVKGVTLNIRRRADRFITIPEWYIYTRKVWPFFIKQ